ncbi:MAG: phytanoyl-CoA dioxygenase family protein [Boseongicola sp.]
MLDVNTQKLDRDGFVVIGPAISREHIDEFEAQIARFSEEQARAAGVERRAAESFIDVFNRGGAYTQRIYELLERLWVLQVMSHGIGEQLKASGFLDWAGIEVPLIWPDIRADLPNTRKRLLPVHQDVRSMKCTRAWRLWIALRPASENLGSVAIYPGTHRRGVIDHNLTDMSKPVIDPADYAGIEPVVLDLPAGAGVLINPLCLHASVPNRSHLTKFTLMVQVQDYASVIDPDDRSDKLAAMSKALIAAGGLHYRSEQKNETV